LARFIDLTDDKLKIPVNDAVIDFIRRTNPSAHTDPGGKLIALGKAVPGARHYSPNYRACAYVVLHTDAQVIFAVAFGMRQLAFRLPPDVLAQGMAVGGKPCPEIGPDWLSVDAFRAPAASAAWDATLQRWVEAAHRAAVERGRRP
jgi:hypothetical protein